MSMTDQVSGLITEVEKARRAEDYGTMHAAADVVLDILADDPSREAFKARAKISYELHMAAYQRQLYRLSMGLAEQSANEAHQAGDTVGELFIKVNIGGLLLPAMGRWSEGIVMHRVTLGEVSSLLPGASSEDTVRLHRVAMNCYAQLIDLAVDHDGDPVEVGDWAGKLESNPFYVANESQSEWGPARLKKARDFVATKST